MRAIYWMTLFGGAWLSCAMATSDTTTSTGTDEVGSVTTGVREAPGGLEIFHVDSTISTISINWTLPTTGPSRYYVQALSLSSGILLTSPVLVNQSKYTMPDLAINTKYRVCVIERYDGDTPEVDHEPKSCIDVGTIAVVRLDSIYALLIAAAFVIFLIGAAFVCWRCAMKKEEPVEENGETSQGDEQAIKSNNADQLPLLTTDSEKPHGKLNASSSPSIISQQQSMRKAISPLPRMTFKAPTNFDAAVMDEPRNICDSWEWSE